MSGLGELFDLVEQSGDNQGELVMPEKGSKTRAALLRLAKMQSAPTDWITWGDFTATYSTTEANRLSAMFSAEGTNALQRRTDDDRRQYRIAPEFYHDVREHLGELDGDADGGFVKFEGGDTSGGVPRFDHGERTETVHDFFAAHAGEWVDLHDLEVYADDERMTAKRASTALSEARLDSPLPVERRQVDGKNKYEYRYVEDDDCFQWLTEQPGVGQATAINTLEAGYRTVQDVADAEPLVMHEEVDHLGIDVAHQIVENAMWATTGDPPRVYGPEVDLPDEVEAEADALLEEMTGLPPVDNGAETMADGDGDEPDADDMVEIPRDVVFAAIIACGDAGDLRTARDLYDAASE